MHPTKMWVFCFLQVQPFKICAAGAPQLSIINYTLSIVQQAHHNCQLPVYQVSRTRPHHFNSLAILSGRRVCTHCEQHIGYTLFFNEINGI